MVQRSAIDQLLTCVAGVHDPGRQPPTTRHPLETILTLTILATRCGAQKWVEIAPWGQAQAAWLAAFLDLPQGIPSHDTFGRVFAVLDPESRQQAFGRWMNALADPEPRDRRPRWETYSALPGPGGRERPDARRECLGLHRPLLPRGQVPDDQAGLGQDRASVLSGAPVESPIGLQALRYYGPQLQE